METKTSEEWQKEYPLLVYDPDGWDRTNFDYSWREEQITYEEFCDRAIRSSLLPKEREG